MRIKLNLIVLLLCLAGAVTVQALSTVEEDMKLVASDGVSSDGFGYASALSGDTLVIGAGGRSSYSGRAVYVFQRRESYWQEQARLTASGSSASDFIGRTVAIDGNVIAAGSYNSDNFSGAVYIFRRQGSQWLEQARLTASDGSAGARFGSSIAIQDDILAVGAQGTYLGGDSGAVYIFQRVGTNWVETAKLTASDGAVGDLVGLSLALDGNTIVVGSVGAAYVFQRTNTGWIERAKLIPSDGENSCVFGLSVAIRKNIIVVGDYCNFQGFIFGAAYIYERSEMLWHEQSKIQASDLVGEDSFGWSVAINERADTVAIGAPLHSTDEVYIGAAYVFKRNGSTWVEQFKLVNSDGAYGDDFGVSIDINENLVVVGALNSDGNETDSGAAYIFYTP